MTRIEIIRELLGDGNIVKKCIEHAEDPDDPLPSRSALNNESAEANLSVSKQVADYDFDDDSKVLAEQEVRAIVDDCAGGLRERDRDNLAFFISCDLHQVATGLEYEVDHPFVTALWLSYQAEELPSEPLEVDRPLKQVLNATRAQAKKLLNQARKIRAGQLAEKQTEKDTFGDRIAAANRRLPDASLLLEILKQEHHNALPWLDGEAVLATTIKELPAGVKLPGTWRKLLRAQAKGEELEWNGIWGGFEKLMPAALTFLKKYCCGIAVVTRDDDVPQLLYVYALEIDLYDCGYTYSAYVSGPPVGARVPKKLREAYDILPPRLQEFYSQVHDGWCQIEVVEYGPVPLGRLYPLLATLDANNLPDIPVENLWEVVRVLGGGRSLCLDANTRERKRPKGVFFYPGEPPESGLDFWKEYKRWLAEGLEIRKMLQRG